MSPAKRTGMDGTHQYGGAPLFSGSEAFEKKRPDGRPFIPWNNSAGVRPRDWNFEKKTYESVGFPGKVANSADRPYSKTAS